MRCACGRSVAAWIVEQARQVGDRAPGRAVVVGLAGYPFMGKTHLAGEVTAAWAPALALPTESVIAPRTERLRRDQDGSSAPAHDLERLDRTLASLVRGDGVTVDVYSWTAGRHTGTASLPGLPDGGLLVVDGSVACETPIARRCDVLVYFQPLDGDAWLAEAVARDLRDRGWSEPAARRENVRKEATVVAQRERHADLVTGLVAVETGDGIDRWTGHLPDCAACRRRQA